LFDRIVIGQKLDMETYLTELLANGRYQVKVVGSDGKVLASGNFSTMWRAHEWIDKRRAGLLSRLPPTHSARDFTRQ
jgi:hypothetical protein